MSRSALDLAAIGNCSVAALVDRGGRIVWWCLPRLDGDPVFCRLLAGERETGFADVDLAGLAAAEQRYVGNTAVVETTLTAADGSAVRIVDFAPRFKRHDRVFRPAMLVRRIEPAAGRPAIRIRVRPRFEYGAAEPRASLGSNHIRYAGPAQAFRLTTDAPVSYIDGETRFVLTEPLTLVFGPDEPFDASVPRVAQEFRERTQEYWVEWVRYLAVPFEWQEAVIRAAIALKLCSHEETGAIVAALTTSVPEAAGTARNWDYRFCWLRDSYFVVHALNRLGATRTMEDYLRYLVSATAGAGDALDPLYAILPDGSRRESVVPALEGYRGFGPVRVGNAAAGQVQNDVYGSVVLAAVQMFFDRRLPRGGDLALFEDLERLGALAERKAFEPDAGIWEYRTRAGVHTYSAAMCWAACDRLARVARRLDLPERAVRWKRSAAEIRERLLSEAWNPTTGSFAATLGGAEVDASLLLLQEIGLVSAADPRFLGTLALVERRLRRGRHLLRYDAPDDFGAPSTAFNSCTFWYIDALAAVGRREEARELFEGVLASRNHAGLLSEDLDPTTSELWGNFPQTYSMVGLIVSAMRLSRSWEEAFWRGS